MDLEIQQDVEVGHHNPGPPAGEGGETSSSSLVELYRHETGNEFFMTLLLNGVSNPHEDVDFSICTILKMIDRRTLPPRAELGRIGRVSH
jgi:hypothetical protein